MTDYTVVWTTAAEDDYARIEDFAPARVLQSSAPDYSVIDRIALAFRRAFRVLEFSPYTCRRSELHSHRREVVVPFGGSGFVALVEIRFDTALVIAIRHQLEQDFRH